MNKQVMLSKEMAYALRHNPKKYNLKLDENGWVDLNVFLKELKKRSKWSYLKVEDVIDVIENSDKKRYEIKNEKIRAVYGHSIEGKLKKEVTKPPNFLYHGTARRNLNSILEKGLLPRGRQYVHLSYDIDIAIEVGKRHSKHEQPVLLKIKAMEAFKEGTKFYKEKDDIWLSDEINPKYIEIMK